MKNVYAVAFVAVAICLVFCIIRSRVYDRRIVVAVRRMLSMGLLAVLANVVIALTTNVSVCMAAYSVFFACLDWLLYFVFMVCLEFSGTNTHPLLKKPLMCALLALDSLSMLVNNWFHHTFDYKVVYTKYGEVCYKPDYLGAYNLHLMLAYMLVVFSLVTLLHKAIKTSEIYREKYLVVLLILAFIVAGDAVFVFTDMAINISIICFALGGIMIYYYTVVFVPRELLKRTITIVVQDMADAVFILDEDGKGIFFNDRAKTFMKEEKADIRIIELECREWKKQYPLDEKDESSFSMTRERDGKKVHYKVYYHNMRDDRGHYAGSFFTIHDRTEEINILEKEHYAATHDELTGLYNRQYFYQTVEELLKENPAEEYLMVCSDIRNFKLVNDVFGQKMGDELLVKIATILREQTLEGEIYGRLESDRFALFMKKEDYREKVFSTAQQTMMHHISGDFSYPLQVCVGVYEIVDKNIPVSVMCDRALMAVAIIKGKYGKDIAYYDEELRNSVLREQELTGELPDAINSGQFHIYLQPQMNAEGKVLGAEALVRWKHPLKGMISPGEFIGIFEKNGQIVKLDQHVWEMACRQLNKWRMQGREDLYLSVNISPKDFYFMDVYKAFMGLVEKYDIPPSRLKLEITETAVMSDLEKQLKLISRLRQAGFIVEMDDFGSGYSSLNMLKDIRVDVLKIDMAFLGKTEDETRARKILKMIVELSRQLEIPVITEGVETADQVEFLKNIGCDMFQGYFFAKPMEVERFEEKYM